MPQYSQLELPRYLQMVHNLVYDCLIARKYEHTLCVRF